MTKKQLAARLRKVRQELDECAEWVERLATELDEPESTLTLVGMTEAAALAGMQYRTFQQRYTRKSTPAPLAVLANGPVWDAAHIKRWAQKAVAA